MLIDRITKQGLKPRKNITNFDAVVWCFPREVNGKIEEATDE